MTYAEYREWTFEERLLWPNVENRVCRPERGGCGLVHPWMTQGCEPIRIPDQWMDDPLQGEHYMVAPKALDMSAFPKMGDYEFEPLSDEELGIAS